MLSRVKVRSYSSSANLGPGFDAIALAHTAFYDEVEININPGEGRIFFNKITGSYASDDDVRKLVIKSIELFKQYTGTNLDKYDINIAISKGIPLASGLGGSSALCVATIKALTKLVDTNLRSEEIIKLASEAERIYSGSPHYDNTAASLLGGLVVVTQDRSGNIIAEKLDLDIWLAIFIPRVYYTGLSLRLLREVIPRTVDIYVASRNSGRLALLVLAALKRDLKLLGKMLMQDEIVEPSRARYIPCYREIVERALEAGALGAAISGSGPAVMALSDSRESAERIVSQVSNKCSCCDIEVAKIARTAPGTEIVSIKR